MEARLVLGLGFRRYRGLHGLQANRPPARLAVLPPEISELASGLPRIKKTTPWGSKRVSRRRL
jgi:hypothetical protein